MGIEAFSIGFQPVGIPAGMERSPELAVQQQTGHQGGEASEGKAAHGAGDPPSEGQGNGNADDREGALDRGRRGFVFHLLGRVERRPQDEHGSAEGDVGRRADQGLDHRRMSAHEKRGCN